MPRFLAPITVAQEYVTSNETITGTETILGATSGRDSYWTTVNIVSGLSADSANFVNAAYAATAPAGTSDTQLATTAFVRDAIDTSMVAGSAVASSVVIYVTNADTVPLTRGTVVYSYGSQGDRVSVKMASASAEAASSKTLGFVNETIAVGGTGFVTLYGSMDKLDLGSPFVAGDPLWLGITPGTYTRTKPVAPIHLVYLGVVERANSGNGTAYIKVQNGYELDELHDVLIQTPLSGQLLQRNSDNTLWINQTPTFAQASSLLNYLPLSGGTITNSLSAHTLSGDGIGLTNLNASNISSGTLSSGRLPAFGGDIITTAGSSSATVVKIQGYPITTQTPSIGQILQWSGTAWVPGTLPTGGSGGGGVTYYLNYGLSANPPVAGLDLPHYELGRFSILSSTSATFTNVSQVTWDTLATFVTDHLDPSITSIPAGIWDLNFWASATTSIQTQMKFRFQAYTYSEALSSTTLLATSNVYNIYDPSVIAQYVLSMIMPQTTIDINARIYLVLQAQATSPNKDITIYYNGDTPTHSHTTIPSIGGSGLVKVVNGVYQSPASLLVDTDVADNAQINQTKISGLTAALATKVNTADIIPISNGGTGATDAASALAALGGFPISGGTITDGLTATSGTFTNYLSSPSISGKHYGDGSSLVNLNISNVSSGVLGLSSGGTGATTIESAKVTLGGIQTAQIRHNSNLTLLSAGNLAGATWTLNSTTLTFTNTNVTLVPGMSINASGLTTTVIRSVDSGGSIGSSGSLTMSNSATAGGSGNVTVFASNVNSLSSSSIVAMDGRTMVVGDIVILTAQTATAQNGPWRLDSLANNVMSFSRPSWFSGTLIGPILFAIQYGSGNASAIIAVEPTNASTTTGAIIGIEPLVGIISTTGRAPNANTSTNTFTGPQTLRVNGTATNQAPIYFQNPSVANTIMTTPQAHAVEWNGSTMFLTTGATYTGSIAGTTLYVTATAQGIVLIGSTISGGTITSGTTITNYLSGTLGGIGAYTVSPSQTVASTTVTGVLRAPITTTVSVPTSSTSVGLVGQISYDSSNFYVCVSANTWRKTNLVAF